MLHAAKVNNQPVLHPIWFIKPVFMEIKNPGGFGKLHRGKVKDKRRRVWRIPPDYSKLHNDEFLYQYDTFCFESENVYSGLHLTNV